MDAHLRAPLKPFGHCSNMISGVLRGAVNRSPIMPRGFGFLGQQTKKYAVRRHRQMCLCAQRNLFEIFSNQSEIRLYLPFSD